MNKYRYSAIDVDGRLVKGQVLALDDASARQQLLLQNLDVRSLDASLPFWQKEIGRGPRVKPTEILHFSRQMAAFIRSGLSVVDGLDLISRSTANEKFAEALAEMRDQVRGGLPFTDALAEHEGLLPKYYVGVIRAAELSGMLDESLDHIATYMEREIEARSKVKQALAYPSIILGLAAVSVIILTVFVLPKFVVLFEELEADLPFTTRVLINFTDFSQSFWFLYPMMAGLIALFVIWMRNNPTTRALIDRTVLRIPLLGEIVLFSTVERVCRILATLWEAGVPIGDAMTAATQSTSNTVFADKLVQVQESVLSGEGLADPIAAADLFPDVAVQMITVGEATGTLADQLRNAADFYARELDYKLKRLTTYFEPAVIIAVSVVVGFVAIALVQAMYGSLSSSRLN